MVADADRHADMYANVGVRNPQIINGFVWCVSFRISHHQLVNGFGLCVFPIIILE